MELIFHVWKRNNVNKSQILRVNTLEKKIFFFFPKIKSSIQSLFKLEGAIKRQLEITTYGDWYENKTYDHNATIETILNK